MPRALLKLALAAIPIVTAPAAAQSACEGEPFHQLDFWLGDWTVFVGETQVGTNTIEAMLGGCAITESWRAGDGSEGRSLFYYVPATKTWKQVWVTRQPAAPGGVKEKELIEVRPDGGLRFQGRIPLADGGTYLDRTTLTPLPDGRVRQQIEISRDGATWQTSFDAVYVRTEKARQ